MTNNWYGACAKVYLQWMQNSRRYCENFPRPPRLPLRSSSTPFLTDTIASQLNVMPGDEPSKKIKNDLRMLLAASSCMNPSGRPKRTQDESSPQQHVKRQRVESTTVIQAEPTAASSAYPRPRGNGQERAEPREEPESGRYSNSELYPQSN